VTVLHALDLSIRDATHGAKSLDDVVRILVAEGGVLSTERVQRASERVSGKDLSAFFKSEVP
jgi:predicted metalloprotease with PDZ domain